MTIYAPHPQPPRDPAADRVRPGRGWAALAAEPGVIGVRSVKMRWLGLTLHVDVKLDVDPTPGLSDAHRIAHDAEHALTPAVPRLTSALVHLYPEDTRSK